MFGKRKPATANPLGYVSFDDLRVVFRCGGRIDEIAWGDLIEVGILTTDEGPIQEDVFFMLLGPTKEKGCSIPQGADGSQKLLERLGCLPDFDQGAVIRAMGSTSNNRFVCWQKKEANQSSQPPPGSSTPLRV